MPKHMAWLLVFLSCWSAQAADNVPSLIGDETKLAKIKANPRDFIGRTAVLTGVVGTADYFNYAYRDAKETHYAFKFTESLKSPKEGEVLTGNHCTLYLRRDKRESRGIANRVSDAARGIPLRVKVILNNASSYDLQWDQLELADVQFQREDGKWSDWLTLAEVKARQIANQNEAQHARQIKDEREKQIAERKAAEDAARWHTWLIDGKKQEAKFGGAIGDNVQLQLEDGNKINVKKQRLSEEDLTWIKARNRAK